MFTKIAKLLCRKPSTIDSNIHAHDDPSSESPWETPSPKPLLRAASSLTMRATAATACSTVRRCRLFYCVSE
jgi:hypothetical protein